MLTHVVGIDPGLVDTGVVWMTFDSADKSIYVTHEVITGPDADAVKAWMNVTGKPPAIFVEKYVPRMKLNSDARMVAAEADLRRVFPKAKFLPNMGIKRVVTQPLMSLLGVWIFPTTTHHQDLRSAARIALFGMMKDPELNAVVSLVVRDHLNGRTWEVMT